ncbi:MAG: methyltransferase domain-containing protein [Actinomycetales bacterium]|nr:methyltransferase domain-containing protein [Actinomycetales bacterium]
MNTVPTRTTPVDVDDLRTRVTRMYRDVALHPERDYHFETGRALAERLGYAADELDAIPAASIDSFAGVGYHLDLADLATGECVLDLGSGSGMDSLLAARHVGSAGSVVGIDMTDEQLDKSRRLAAEAGLAQVEFRRGYVEDPPVPDASIDVVISNGVVNLSADKGAVFAHVVRVLRPGGRLALSDIVTERALPESVTCNAGLWAACIGGAMQSDAYQEAIERAGLEIDVVRRNDGYRFLSDQAVNATTTWGVMSISLLARRPG